MTKLSVHETLQAMNNGSHELTRTNSKLAKLHNSSYSTSINNSNLVNGSSTSKSTSVRHGCCAATNGWKQGKSLYLVEPHLEILQALIEAGDYKNVPDPFTEEYGEGIAALMKELDLPSKYEGIVEVSATGNGTVKAHKFTHTAKAGTSNHMLKTLMITHIIRGNTIHPNLIAYLNMFELKAQLNCGWYQALALGHYKGMPGRDEKNYNYLGGWGSYPLFYGDPLKLELDVEKVNKALLTNNGINNVLHGGSLDIVTSTSGPVYREEQYDPLKGKRVLGHPYYDKKGTISKKLLEASNGKLPSSGKINLGRVYPTCSIINNRYQNPFINTNKNKFKDYGKKIQESLVGSTSLEEVLKKCATDKNAVEHKSNSILIKHPIRKIERDFKKLNFNGNPITLIGWTTQYGVHVPVYEERVVDNRKVSLASKVSTIVQSLYFDNYVYAQDFGYTPYKGLYELFKKHYGNVRIDALKNKLIKEGAIAGKSTNKYINVIPLPVYFVINNLQDYIE